QVENSSLSGKESALGSGDDRGETSVAPGLYAFVGERSFVCGAAPGSRPWTIFGSVRGRLTATTTPSTALAATFGCSSKRNSDISERVKETWVNGQAFAFDNVCVRGNGHILATNSENHATRDNDGRVIQNRPRNGNNFCSTDGEILRLATLRSGARRPCDQG